MSPDKAQCNTLFVVLPNKETLTARKLPQRITLDYLKAKLELATGIHGNAMHLTYGGHLLTDDVELCFGENLRNGGLMKLLVADKLLDVYFAICDSDIQKTIGCCVERDDEMRTPEDADSTSEVELSADDKKFFSLLLACKQGSLDLITALLNLDPEGLWKKQCTRFRRTLAHVAAASDQTKTIELLLEREAPVQTSDCFNNTPLDVAVLHGAYACERLIRQTLMRKKSSCGQQLDKTSRRKSGLKVCWKDNREHAARCRTSLSGTVQLYGGLQLDSGVVCGTPLSSSRRTSANYNRYSSRASSTTPGGDQQYRSQSHGTTDKRRNESSRVSSNHKQCIVRPPFMAFRSVPQEELRPVTVEYVPLPQSTESCPACQHKEKPNPDIDYSHHIPKAPCSSLNNSTEDLTLDNGITEREALLQKRYEMMRRYTKIKGVSSRAQSAKYYRTKYHIEAECDASIPKPRPSTAGPRYREWKTWLLEQMEEEAKKQKTSWAEEQRRRLNELAYRKWLARHRRQKPNDDLTTQPEANEDEDDEEKREQREEAYRQWLESKRLMFEEMDRKRREDMKPESTNKRPQLQRDRRIAVFEIGACLDGPAEPSKPDRYIRAYQTWIRNKKNYENWKRRNGLSVEEKTMSRDEFIRTRDSLLMDGMTYNEWLGLKAREHNVNKLHIHKF